jgi:hypothetical protein
MSVAVGPGSCRAHHRRDHVVHLVVMHDNLNASRTVSANTLIRPVPV